MERVLEITRCDVRVVLDGSTSGAQMRKVHWLELIHLCARCVKEQVTERIKA